MRHLLRIDQLRLLPDQPESDLTAKCARLLRTDPSSLRDLTVLRRAIDAREGLTFVYTVAVSAPQEAALLRRCRDKRVTAYVPEHYVLPAPVAPPEVRPIVVGAGPAGLFAALVLVRCGARPILLERGQPVEQRSRDVTHFWRTGRLDTESNVQFGEGGAGAFSDGKLSLSHEVGGDLPTLVGERLAQETIDYADSIYLEFGADTHIEGISDPDKVKDIRRRAIQAGLKLVDCPIRHMGTEKAQGIYLAIERYLAENGVELIFGWECLDLRLKDETCLGGVISNGKEEREIEAGRTIVATGRRGADWLETLCAEHGIAHQTGTVDIGVRVEVRNEIMETVNEVLYESKLIGYPAPFKNKVRTFCQNPGGFVSQENYDNGLAVVNGHSFKEVKSPNTNLSILCSHNFSVPFNQPISYAQKVGELTNMLANGHILVQRYGDILDGKRTWEKELAQSNVRPTLPDAVAGDITAAMPYRSMTNIINFIKAVDQVVPGFASYETLLYSPELKFYSNRVKMDADLNTNIRHLHCLGDSSGWTRGLMMASVMGVLMGREIIRQENI